MASARARPFRADDEMFVRGLRRQSFTAPLDVELWSRHGHVLEHDGTRVAALLARRVAQWVGGRSVPCVAISSVMVDLPRRGGGVMAELLGPVLRRHADGGAAISTLTPSAMAPYRRAGYEVAGHRFRFHAASRSLRLGAERDDIRWFQPGDVDRLAEIYDGFARRGNGPIHRDRQWWHSHILPRVRSGETFAIVAERDGEPTGYALWDQVEAPRPGEPAYLHRVRAREIVWSTVSAAHALLHALARAGSPGEEISWIGSPSDGMAGFFDDPVLVDWARPWMTKILDLPAALSARGYSTALDLSVVLGINDAGIARTLRLAVRGGRAHTEEVTVAPHVTMDASSFASIFTGRSTGREAQALGRLQAVSPEVVERLDALFAGPTPWLFEHF
ncbi:GNAT family N-acetyltransferase [Sphaerisporangium rufum]|nr:GNAT family N-acetyltransferase [Sphaerisporangium rufum]